MEEIDQSLARAVLARTLKQGLRFPTPRTLQAFSCETGRRALRQSVKVLEGESGGPLAEAVEGLCHAKDVAPSSLERAYESLFGHALRGRVCPYETEYGAAAPFQQSQELADIAGFYLAFGLEATQAGGERLDHAACELEFLEFLSMKEAWATEQGDAEMLEVTRKAARDFVRGHLGRFGVAFGSSLQREDPGGFYGRLGALCAAFLRAECVRQGIATGPEFLDLRPAEDDGVPMACGDGSGDDQEEAEPQLLGIRSRREGDGGSGP